MHPQQRTRSVLAVTLIELMVALALVGIVMTAAGTILLQAYANESAYRQQNSAQVSARTALDAITDDMRNAKKTFDSSESPAVYPKNTVVIGGSSGANTASFTANTVDMSTGNDAQKTVFYKLDQVSSSSTANCVVRQVNSGTFVAVARNITSLAMSKPYSGVNNYNVVRVTVTAQDGSSTVTLTGDVSLRNNLVGD